ncbi:MAG: M14 family zinc carboxypeptidase, partial [bacterium]
GGGFMMPPPPPAGTGQKSEPPPATGSPVKPSEIASRLKAMASGVAKVSSYGKSNEGRDLWVITFSGAGDPGDKPGVLYIAGLRGNDGLAITAALDFALSLVDAANDNTTRQLFESRTIYIIPLANPDGAGKGTPYLTRPWDDDNDGVADEDPADGDSKDKDDDDDGKKDEDGPMGLDLLLNFAAGWKAEFIQGHNGPFPMSEPESKSLADWVIAHPNLVAAYQLYGTGANFLYPLSRRSPGAPEDDDKAVFAAIGKTFEDGLSGDDKDKKVKSGTLNSDPAPDSEKDNSFLDWLYQNWAVYPAAIGVKDAAPEKLMPLLRDAAMSTPMLSIDDPEVEDLNGGFFRITVTVKNTGKMGTLSKAGRGQRPRRPVVLWLDLPRGASLQAGPVRKKVDFLDKDKDEKTVWVVRGAAGSSVTVNAFSAKSGRTAREIILKATPPKEKMEAPKEVQV